MPHPPSSLHRDHGTRAALPTPGSWWQLTSTASSAAAREPQLGLVARRRWPEGEWPVLGPAVGLPQVVVLVAPLTPQPSGPEICPRGSSGSAGWRNSQRSLHVHSRLEGEEQRPPPQRRLRRESGSPVKAGERRRHVTVTQAHSFRQGPSWCRAPHRLGRMCSNRSPPPEDHGESCT